MRKRASAVEKLGWIESLSKDVADSAELLELGAADNDEAITAEVEAQVPALRDRVRKAELQRMLSARQLLLMSRTRDRAIEIAIAPVGTVVFLPNPDFRRCVFK